jgi:hypothetical protein
MIKSIETQKDNLIAIHVNGKISERDVERINILIDSIVHKRQKPDFYFELGDFHGYTLKGLLTNFKTDAKYVNNYGKIAFVGDKKWEEWASRATTFFTRSEVKFFDIEDSEIAKNWINF